MEKLADDVLLGSKIVLTITSLNNIHILSVGQVGRSKVVIFVSYRFKQWSALAQCRLGLRLIFGSI